MYCMLLQIKLNLVSRLYLAPAFISLFFKNIFGDSSFSNISKKEVLVKKFY